MVATSEALFAPSYFSCSKTTTTTAPPAPNLHIPTFSWRPWRRTSHPSNTPSLCSLSCTVLLKLSFLVITSMAASAAANIMSTDTATTKTTSTITTSNGSSVDNADACHRLKVSSPQASSLISFLQELQSSALASLSSSASASSFDPKTYVDLPLRFPLNDTIAAFRSLPHSDNAIIAPEIFKKFINDYFKEAGSDLVNYTPLDYIPEPPGFLPQLHNSRLRAWALKVHAIWLELSRKVSPTVKEEPNQHTLLPLPNPVIVPGSRFREVYYWDSYWIIRGLLVSKMFNTAKGMVENLLHLIEVYGFVLNGARTYYENRSQPPLLSMMVWEVYTATKDVELLHKALPLLIREHKYWTSDPKQVTILDAKGQKHLLSRYYANWKAPRPESFTIDMEVAKDVPEDKKELLYHDIASAAESGWDFGSRWMRNSLDLSTLFTSSIVPADLNAYIFQMEMNIAFMAKTIGDQAVTRKFTDAADARRSAIHSILWNDNVGQWFDYILTPEQCRASGNNEIVYIWKETNQHKVTSASNFVPLWTGVLNTGDSKIDNIVEALIRSGLIYPAGVATSVVKTGQQWDFPNAWPPLQHMVIEGLAKSGSKKAKALARTLAERWIETNYAVFNSTGHMLEKYDATVCGGTGGGGEYALQTGFGWSNGVVLCLLNDFGSSLNISMCANGVHHNEG